MTANPKPHLAATELERAILGSVLQDQVVLERLKAVITPEDFSDNRHKHVYASMLQLAAKAQPVDHLTLSERLRALGVLAAVGGPQYLMELDQGVPLAHAAPDYAREVRGLAIRRNALKALQEAAGKANDLQVGVDQLLSDVARSWASLTHSVKGVRSGAEHVLELMDDLDKAQTGENEPVIPTGIDRWDEVFGGLQPGKLTFVGALPGVGKSSLFVTMVENLCKSGRKIGFFSLEDLGRFIPRRIIAKRAKVPLFVLAMKPLTKEQMSRVSAVSEGVHKDLQNLQIDERSMLTPAQVVQSARDMIVNYGVEAIFLDHLGKLNFEPGKHHAFDLAVEHGLNELTALAKEYDIPIVIAAHLKERDKDARFQRPDLESFARTAYIGRDARVAVGLYLDKEDDRMLRCAVLKQTEGEGSGDFELGLLKEVGMLCSTNGQIRADNYQRSEARMLQERE